MQVKEVKLKNFVIQENLKLLKKLKISVNDFTENICELIADKLRKNENSTLQMFNEKDKNEMKVCRTQIIFYKINKLICKSEKVDYKIKYTSQKSKEFLCKKVNTFMKTSELQKFSENAAIHELKLKIQLAEQEHLNL